MVLSSLSSVAAQEITVPAELVSYPDTIVINGKIVTMDNTAILASDPGRIEEAMALRDGRVFALGTNNTMQRLAGPDTRMLDVRGKTVIPGIIETHVHPESTMNSMHYMQGERDAYSLIPGLHTAMLMPGNNPADTYARIRELLREYPPEPGEWVHIRLIPNEATDYPDIGALTNGIYNQELFTRQGLSQAVPDNPATLSSGTGPSVILQPGLVVRVRVGPDRKAQAEALSVPDQGALELPRRARRTAGQPNDPFGQLFRRNAEKDRRASLHTHIEQGCGFAELYPHHMQHCSHRVFLLNQNAVDITLDIWPGYTQAANEVTGLSDIGHEGDRGIVGGVLQENDAWQRAVFPSRVPQGLYNELMEHALRHYNQAGVSMIASSAELGRALTAVYALLRRDKRLPVRWGFGFEMFRSPLLYPTQPQLVKEFGAHQSTPEVNPWFWPMGITDGGAGDSRRVACFGQDLPGPEMLKDRELCWDHEAYRVQQVLIPAVEAGWRPFSLHSFGSEAFRKHVEWIEEARISGGLSMADIRELRIGFAHGGAIGKIPDVIQLMKDYNLYVPIQPNDVAASLDQVKRYGPEGLEFLAPTKTLLEAGVKVVGETEYSEMHPGIYFNALDMFVNRRIRDADDSVDAGEIIMPEEAVSRATALRLFTSRAAEWLFAEEVAGTLEAGKLADFTVLERDYFSVPREQILDNKAIMTVVGDKIMYQDPDWQPGISTTATPGVSSQ